MSPLVRARAGPASGATFAMGSWAAHERDARGSVLARRPIVASANLRPQPSSMHAAARPARLALTALLLATLLPTVASTQSLRGSRASIDRMYRQARAERFSFFETAASVRRQVAARRLVRLEPDGGFVLHRVGYPFVRPATRTFVQRLGAQYLEACGEPLVVTSAVRPARRQPANSSERSVHPTGMAIDLRKPTDAACLRWLRDALLGLERGGLIEATEEWAPPHFHVAVFATPYARYAAARERAEERERLAARGADADASYVVRPGDTLWAIAREHETTVDALAAINDIEGDEILPGQELKLPAADHHR